MPPHTLHYSHILFSRDGAITPLVPAYALPTHLVTVLPPEDAGIIALQELPQNPTSPNLPSENGDTKSTTTTSSSSRGTTSSPEPKPDQPKKEKDPSMGKEPCVYFNRREGCKRGPQCRFLHESSSEERKRRVTQNETWRRAADEQAAVEATATVARAEDVDPVDLQSPDPTQTVTDIACPTPGRIVSAEDPQRTIKTHCTFFLRFKECDYWPDCKFSHEKPEGHGTTKVMRNSSYSWGRLGDARPAALCGAGEDDGDEADLAEEASVRGSESNLASSAGNCRSGSEELITFVD